MDAVLRATAVYLFLLLIFRITGKRSLAQITTFDFVLLLIIAETSQQALLGEDFSVTNCFLLVITLVSLEVFLTLVTRRFPALDKIIEGVPLVVVANGRPLRDRLEKSGLEENEILAAARESQGLERMDQIKYAVLERTGGISIIPMDAAK